MRKSLYISNIIANLHRYNLSASPKTACNSADITKCQLDRSLRPYIWRLCAWLVRTVAENHISLFHALEIHPPTEYEREEIPQQAPDSRH
jgi:hypothetical protein